MYMHFTHRDYLFTKLCWNGLKSVTPKWQLSQFLAKSPIKCELKFEGRISKFRNLNT